MQTLPIPVPDDTFRLWEQLSSAEKQTVETRLNRALRAFLFQKNSADVQQIMAGKGPYQSAEDLLDNVS